MSAAAAVAGQPSSDREGGWGSSILPAEEVEATTEAAAAAGTPVGAEATNANTMQRTAEMHEAAGVAYTSRHSPCAIRCGEVRCLPPCSSQHAMGRTEVTI